jgi:glycosyltransferase involved in cell wall biosynthesis
MSDRPLKITVITVCYNSVATIVDTLRSVATQTWPHVEHIVIDGLSNDGTMSVINQYRSGVANVVSEPDNGIYDAMNKGLKLSTGDIICFLNADDVYVSDVVLEVVANTIQSKLLDALIGDVGFVRSIKNSKLLRRYRSDRFSKESLAWGWMPAHPGLFLRREVFDLVGKFNTNYRIAGDFEFIVRAFCGHSLQYQHLPQMLVYMRVGGASNKGIRSKILLNREVLRACRENNLDTNIFKILSKYPLKILEYLIR